jgi:hypothetical protein
LAGAGSVYLHIGEPKTGTTYIQKTLWTNRRRLARNGLFYPASKDTDHWAAAQDLRGI